MAGVNQIWSGRPNLSETPTRDRVAPYVARVTDETRDARVAPVEDNLLDFLAGLASVPLFEHDAHPDVTTYHSDMPHPLFNGVVGGWFAPGTEETRTRDVISRFVERGLPFLWWSTPTTWSQRMDRVLTAAGAVREDLPGMHADLTAPGPEARPVDGLEISVAGGAGAAETLARLLCAGFEMPDDLVEPVRGLFSDIATDRMVNLVATLDGEPVACGTAWITGPTVGLYNIATLAGARGRGVGHALTAALMDEGRRRGCTQSILHATVMGRPVYERLGFVEVCHVPQYVWLPDA
jgi:GNAT superfamily N-acetyltransferase